MPADRRLRDHLRSLLGPLPAAAEALCSDATVLRLDKGANLLRDGDRWTSLWWVAQGALRLYYLDRDGRASNKNFYFDGALLWPITPDLAGEPVGFWVDAVEISEVHLLPWAPWQAAAGDWATWQRFERKVLAALLQDKMRRERQFLQRTATERYQALVAERPDWADRLPLHHLASYLGVTDVALSRIRRRLAPLNPG